MVVLDVKVHLASSVSIYTYIYYNIIIIIQRLSVRTFILPLSSLYVNITFYIFIYKIIRCNTYLMNIFNCVRAC